MKNKPRPFKWHIRALPIKLGPTNNPWLVFVWYLPNMVKLEFAFGAN